MRIKLLAILLVIALGLQFDTREPASVEAPALGIKILSGLNKTAIIGQRHRTGHVQ